MKIDPAKTGVREVYQHMVRLITPRPIAWVSTISLGGVTNLAPFSFFNGVGANPPTIVFCPVNRRDGTKKDTLLNIEQTGQFVVNIVSFSVADRMNDSAAEYDREESEFTACGLTAVPSDFVRPPRVAESLAQLECTLQHAISLAAGPAAANLIVGRIVMMHIEDDVLDERLYADPAKLDSIGRLGGAGYCRTTERFDLPRPTINRETDKENGD